jgi:hypothetical protein
MCLSCDGCVTVKAYKSGLASENGLTSLFIHQANVFVTEMLLDYIFYFGIVESGSKLRNRPLSF